MADLARTGLIPYRVAPPDLLRIIVPTPNAKAGETPPSDFDGEYLVGPDGTIKLRTVGSVSVHGKTVKEIQKAIETKLTELGREEDLRRRDPTQQQGRLCHTPGQERLRAPNAMHTRL